jgi:hypothetical protein
VLTENLKTGIIPLPYSSLLFLLFLSLSLPPSPSLGKQAIWHCGEGYAEGVELKWTVTRHTLAKVKKSSFLGTTRIKKIIPAGDFCVWIDGTM